MGAQIRFNRGVLSNACRTPQTDALRGRFRLLSWNNEIFITSGGLERVQEWGQQRLHYHMITEIERAAKRCAPQLAVQF